MRCHSKYYCFPHYEGHFIIQIRWSKYTTVGIASFGKAVDSYALFGLTSTLCYGRNNCKIYAMFGERVRLELQHSESIHSAKIHSAQKSKLI